jgi:hypothetical protein
MDQKALDYLLMMHQNESPPLRFNGDMEDFRGIMQAFGDLDMKIPPDARMSDNVIDMRPGKKRGRVKREMPDNIEISPHTGILDYKPEDDQPPLPKMFEHDVRRTIFENVLPHYYYSQQFEREWREQQAREQAEKTGVLGALKKLLGIR